MTNDTLTRARAVLGRLRVGADGTEAEDYALHAEASGPLIRLAEAVGRLAGERLGRGSDPWYQQFGWHDGAYMPCIGCELMDLDANTGDHAPDCPALAIDAALAELAALATEDVTP